MGILILALFGFFWHIFAITGMLLLAPYGKKWEGFYIGLLLGPIGLTLVFFMRDRIRAEEQQAARAEKLGAEIASLRQEIVDRLPNGKPQGSQGF